ncbi:hypothetical protein [Arthrobacter sp. zg-Y1110]|nr:hypothetical protein [Arthrobacter sp. zg-Y1110]UWX84895.1 hypothetical protein N2K99_15815 [Arthrobacter sp. zg-Y1110]
MPLVLVIGGVVFWGASSQRKRAAEEFRVGPPAEGSSATENT